MAPFWDRLEASPFWNNRKERYTIIIGCSSLGASLADRLSDEGESVIVIDRDQDSFRKLSQNYGGLTLVGDVTSFDVLDEAEIKRATAVISVTNHDNTNIMIAQIAKELFGIEHVIARLYDADRKDVYQEFGIDTISPAILSIKEIDKLLETNPSDKSAQ